MDNKETTTSFRSPCFRKAQTKEIIDIYNNEREPNEPKKNYRLLQDWFIDSHKDDPKFFNKLERIEIKEKLSELYDKKEFIDFQINKYESKLNEIENQIKNDTLDSYSKPEPKQITLTPKLERALNNLVGTCKQRGKFTYEEIPNEYFTGVSQSFEVKKTDLIRAIKTKLESNPDYIKNYDNESWKTSKQLEVKATKEL